MIDHNDPRLTALVLGELDAEEAAEIQAEMHQHPEIAQAVEEIRRTTTDLTAEFAREAPVGLRANQRESLAEAATSSIGVSRGVRASSLSLNYWAWASVAIAASLLAILMTFPTGQFDQGLAVQNPSELSVTPDSVTPAFGNRETTEAKSDNTVKHIEPPGEAPPIVYPPAEEWGPLSKRRKAAYSEFDVKADELEGGGADFDTLMDLITSTIAPDNWDDVGGPGSIAPFERKLSLVINNSQEVHDGDDLGIEGRGLDESLFRNKHRDSSEAPVSGSFLGPVRVEFLEGTDVFIVRGQRRDVERVERILRDVEKLSLIDVGTADLDQRPNLSFSVNSATNEPAEASQPATRILSVTKSPTEDSPPNGEAARADEITQRIRAKLLKNRNREAQPETAKTWRRVKAVPNTSRLMVGDKEELDLNGMQVNVQVDGFRARVLIDYFYYNDRDQQLEGTFKIRLPDDASLYYFAFGQSAYTLTPQGDLAKDEFIEQRGSIQPVSLRVDDIRRERGGAWQNVKEARIVPREKAAFAYGQTVRRRVDPALVEWSGAGVFNARVFPLMPRKLHRIVVGYDVNLTETDESLVYELDVPEQVIECKVDIHVRQVAESSTAVTSSPNARELVTNRGRHYHIDRPASGEPIRLVMSRTENVFLRSHHEKEGDFIASRIRLDVPGDAAKSNSHAVFLLDTSLSSQPDKLNVWLELLRATLDNNRDSLRKFAVLFFNVENHFWKERYIENTSENVRQLVTDCQQLVLEGATDLYSASQSLAEADWIKESHPDLFLLSDGAANWGETNLRLVHQVLDAGDLGSLFAYQTGLSGTAIANLRFLAGQTGGAVFSVANEDEVEKASKAHRARPWQLVNISSDGLSDLLTAGRLKWAYPGQSVTLVGRVDSDSAAIGQIDLQFKRGNETKMVSITPDVVLDSTLASRLYGQVAVGQLESLGQTDVDVAAAYARHFRITGDTCSLLMLEAEEDYERFDIRPQEDLLVIKTTRAGSLIASSLKERSSELANPRSQLLVWLSRLESMPGMEFKLPTALQLTLDKVQVSTISEPLRCEILNQDQLAKQYLNQLSGERLDYDAVMKEAARRGETSGDDAVRVLSSLVEQNTGDLVLARDVAFSAMEMNRPAQAYHLLKRIAKWRPYDPSIYMALGQCLVQMGEADMAILFYEVAIGAKFESRSDDFRKIAGTEYAHLLREIIAGRQASDLQSYARARLESLSEKLGITNSADLLIAMMWNTDQTDVDLHVIEPSGEECFYSHPKTRSGGQLTRDITDGFGPEMYSLSKAPNGEYQVWVKYFSTNPNRAGMRSKVYLTIYQDLGTGEETIIRQVINVSKPGHKEQVKTLAIK